MLREIRSNLSLLALTGTLLLAGSSCRFAGICLNGEESCASDEAVPDSAGDCTSADLARSWNATSDSAVFRTDCTMTGVSSACHFSGTYNGQVATTTELAFVLNVTSVSGCAAGMTEGNYNCDYHITYSVPLTFESPSNLSLKCTSAGTGNIIIDDGSLKP